MRALHGLNSRKINYLHSKAQVQRIIGGKAAQPDRLAAAAGHAAAPRCLVVDDAGAGQRLDNYLQRLLKGVPKTHVYRIIRSGEVRINKGRAGADTRVQAGDLVRLPPLRVSAQPAEKAARPVPAREFPVLLEDEHLIAIDKPAGLAVHGGSGLAFGVIEQLRRARPAGAFLELVHRLDRETSGILLLAKKRPALTGLQQQFRARAAGKTYLALVAGAWPAGHKVIDLALHKYLLADGQRRVRVAGAGHDAPGLRAITLVRLHSSWPADAARGLPALSLLEVTIKTGRTHQIRVHLASQGHAIAGDDKYGDFALNKRLHKLGLQRMFLHAWRLQLRHPASGAALDLQAALAPELAAFLPPAPPTFAP